MSTRLNAFGRGLGLVIVTATFAHCGVLLGVDFDKAHPQPARDHDDGATDATAASDTTPGVLRFCDTISPAPFLCADFEGDDLRAGWGAPGLTPDLSDTAGGKSERVELDADSPTELGRYAARFTAPALLTKAKLATAGLFKQLPRVRDLAVNFKMRVVSEQFEPGGRVELFELSSGDEFGAGSRRVEGTLLMTRTVGGVTQSDIFDGALGGPWLTHDEFDPWPVNAWRNVQVVMGARTGAGDAGANEIIVRLDNEIQSRRVVSEALFASLPIALFIGIVAVTGPSNILRIELDNVRVDLTPATN